MISAGSPSQLPHKVPASCSSCRFLRRGHPVDTVSDLHPLRATMPIGARCALQASTSNAVAVPSPSPSPSPSHQACTILCGALHHPPAPERFHGQISDIKLLTSFLMGSSVACCGEMRGGVAPTTPPATDTAPRSNAPTLIVPPKPPGCQGGIQGPKPAIIPYIIDVPSDKLIEPVSRPVLSSEHDGTARYSAHGPNARRNFIREVDATPGDRPKDGASVPAHAACCFIIALPYSFSSCRL